MAVNNPPGWLQNAGVTHTAEELRNWVSMFLVGTSGSGSLLPLGGIHPALGFELVVTQTGSPSMAVIVRSGHAAIPGSEGSRQGCYFVMNDADVTLSINAAHATLPRIDSVVFKVQDSQYSGITNTSSLVVVAGTPAGSPTPPALPLNSIELGRVAVGAAVTSITNANITDKRTFLSQGVIPCNSTTRPAPGTVTSGQLIAQLDNNTVYVTWDAGATWVDLTKRPHLTGVFYGTAGDLTVAAGNFLVVANLTFSAQVGATYILTATGRIKGSVGGSQAIIQGKHKAGGGPVGSGDASTPCAMDYVVPTDTSVGDFFCYVSEFVASASGTYTAGLIVNFFSGSGTVTVNSSANSQLRLGVTEGIPV